MSNETSPPSSSTSGNILKLQAQLERMKVMQPQSRQVTLTLSVPVYKVLTRLAKRTDETIGTVAGNILSGWVAEVADEYDAAQQKSPPNT